MDLGAHEIARLVGGSCSGPDRRIGRIETDLELFDPARDLFVGALHREDMTVRDRLPSVARAGGAYMTDAPPVGSTSIVVRDAVGALRELGEHQRSELTSPVVAAIGGSAADRLVRLSEDGFSIAPDARCSRMRSDLRAAAAILNAGRMQQIVVADTTRRHRGRTRNDIELLAPDVIVVAGGGPMHSSTLGGPDAWRREVHDAMLAAPGATLVAAAPIADSLGLHGCIRYGVGGEVFVDGGHVVGGDWHEVVIATPDGPIELSGPVAVFAMTEVLGLAALAQALGADARRVVRHGLSADSDLVSCRTLASGTSAFVDCRADQAGEVLVALEALAALDVPRRFAVLGPLDDGVPATVALESSVGAHARRLGVPLLAVGPSDYGAPQMLDPGELGRFVAALGPGSVVYCAGVGVQDFTRPMIEAADATS